MASAILYRDDAALYGRHWGTDIASPGAALRAVLLPGHRIRHPPRPAALRAGCRASTSWRAASSR
ncbi:MAG: hypothetical protein M5R42_09585 [Rhodocyclaceae bacterium]|nr:hypothetical protein [Rhodocyclaceae bacterium]